MAHFLYLMKSSDSKAQLDSLLNDSADRPDNMGHKLMNYMRGLLGGARSAKVMFGGASGSSDPVQASASATFSGVPLNADTITINGVVITFVDGTPGNNQVKRDDAPSNSDLASRLASAINNSTSDSLSGVVSASASSAVVTISCNIPGVIGNLIPLSESATGLAVSGANLSSGSGRLPVLLEARFSR